MMTSTDRRVTGGVDTHDDVHVAAVLDSATGRQLGTHFFWHICNATLLYTLLIAAIRYGRASAAK